MMLCETKIDGFSFKKILYRKAVCVQLWYFLNETIYIEKDGTF